MPVTNIIESLHTQPRKIIKNRGHFPAMRRPSSCSGSLRNITAGEVRSTREWKDAINQFAVLYGDRCTSPKN
jgi:putative transposase